MRPLRKTQRKICNGGKAIIRNRWSFPRSYAFPRVTHVIETRPVFLVYSILTGDFEETTEASSLFSKLCLSSSYLAPRRIVTFERLLTSFRGRKATPRVAPLVDRQPTQPSRERLYARPLGKNSFAALPLPPPRLAHTSKSLSTSFEARMRRFRRGLDRTMSALAGEYSLYCFKIYVIRCARIEHI